MAVNYLWCGAPTATTLRPIVVLTAAGTVRVAFSKFSDMSSPVWTSSVTADSLFAARPGDATGLTPDTRYYYAAEVNGVLDTSNIARARTLPASRQKLTITFGSCWAATGQRYHGVENHAVGAAIAKKHDDGANMHLFAGDMGYLDDQISDPNPWKDNFAKLHAMPYFSQFARSCAWDSVWDDHDFGGNDSNGTFANKALAASSWRQFVPNYNLPVSSGPIYHAFNLTPDVRVVVTDLRYYRDPNSTADTSSKTMMGATQKAWLKNEWLTAKNNGQLIIWVSSSIWGVDGNDGNIGTNVDGDGWWRFTYEQNELDAFRAANGIKNMVILTGDGHQISYRTNVDYSNTNSIPTPVYASAAYSMTGAFRPAAWNAATTFLNCSGHYGVLTIDPLPIQGWKVSCEFHTVSSTVSTNDVVEFSTSQYFNRPTSYGVMVGGVFQKLGANSLAQQ